VLVFVLARRLGFIRATSAAAALLFAVSPLAVDVHRIVFVENIATPWLLASFALALARRRQSAAFIAAAVCLGVAVLTDYACLLAIPFVAWTMVRSSHPETRRYVLSVATSALVFLALGYVLLAIVKDELLAPAGMSVLNDLTARFATRSVAGDGPTLAEWWQLDAVFLVSGVTVAVVGVFLRRLRPIAALQLALIAAMLIPGAFSGASIVLPIPFAAILIAGVVGWAATTARGRTSGRAVVAAILALALALLAVAAAIPLYYAQGERLTLLDRDSPTRGAEQWLSANLVRDSRLIVDDTFWVDLRRAGWKDADVVSYYRVGTGGEDPGADPGTAAPAIGGWQDFDYIITTQALREATDATPEVASALDNSVVVAAFGTRDETVQVRRIAPDGIDAAREDAVVAGWNRLLVGEQFSTNPRLVVDAADRALLAAGQVDSRIPLTLAPLAATADVEVAGFPAIEGESELPRRRVQITSIGGAPTVEGGTLSDAADEFVASLVGDFAPVRAIAADGGLEITFSPDAASDLIR
jgi:hypothetical protein